MADLGTIIVDEHVSPFEHVGRHASDPRRSFGVDFPHTERTATVSLMTKPQTAIEVYNGEAQEPEWECGGYRFQRTPDYADRVRQLPRLAGSRNGIAYEGNVGENVVTFVAEPVNDEAARPSRWLKGGTSLHDVLILWSFVGGVPVLVPPLRRTPTADERGYVLAEDDEVVPAVVGAYVACRRRPVKRRIWSALLTYLEIAHVRPMQVKAVLVASVLECMAPLAMQPQNEEDRSRYKPIVEDLAALPQLANLKTPKGSVEALIVELYRLRNGFLHGGVQPYRDDIDLGEVKVTTGRIVSAARKLAKLALANALGVPDTWSGGMLARQVQTLFTDGSFVPKDIETLLRKLAPPGGE
jgi:hypothetical protein